MPNLHSYILRTLFLSGNDEGTKITIESAEAYNHFIDFVPANAIDGDVTTIYTAEDGDVTTNWLKLTLAEAYSVKTVKVINR